MGGKQSKVSREPAQKKGEGQCPGKSRADYSDNTRLMDDKAKTGK